MKYKIIIIVLTLIGIIMLLSCCVDFYYDKRPNNYDNTKWVSSDPDIWFTVNKNECFGEITIDGVTMETQIFFDFGTGVDFKHLRTLENQFDYYKDDYYYFRGSCKFDEYKLVVTITDNSKGLLDDSIKKITFVREDILLQ